MNKNEFLIRGATPLDDPAAIAKYLYLTDDFIYPSLCPSFSDADWVGFIHSNLQNRQHVFSSDNLLVVEQNGLIVAVCCLFRCGRLLHFLRNTPPKDQKNYEYVDKNYFRPLLGETMLLDGIYIGNLCVEPDLRGKGIGKALLQYVVAKFSEDDIFLDVLENNLPAVGLYELSGFRVQQKHSGFGGKNRVNVSCLRMVRPKKNALLS